ncbi:hypothetical protein IIA15_00285 [candidate division TA06 bacterium]|nr:hypothetical protein [candidate division TA06 bacterium]
MRKEPPGLADQGLPWRIPISHSLLCPLNRHDVYNRIFPEPQLVALGAVLSPDVVAPTVDPCVLAEDPAVVE